MAKKNKALGLKVRAQAGRNPAFGRAIDKLPHHSPARNKMAKRKMKKY